MSSNIMNSIKTRRRNRDDPLDSVLNQTAASGVSLPLRFPDMQSQILYFTGLSHSSAAQDERVAPITRATQVVRLVAGGRATRAR